MLRASAPILLGLALLTCGPRTTPDQPDDPARSAERDQPRDPEPTPADDCPASFDYALVDGACDPEGARGCSFAEADCRCAARPPCTGVDPGADVELDHAWSCTFKDPEFLRPDGCPAMVPDAGACAEEGKVCVYSPYCAGIASTATCSGGVWGIEQRELAPPPSADPG